MVKKILKYPVLVLFFLFIFGYTVFDLCHYNRATSELENRDLAQRPAFHLKEFYNNEFSPKYETYINDQFVLRDQWITLKSVSESLLGKTENNGIMYGEDGFMFQHYMESDVDLPRIQKNIGFLNEFIQMYPQLNISVGIIPNAYTVYPEYVPMGAGQADQIAHTNEIYAALPESVTKMDFLPAFTQHKDEYIFYRTDHHWTTLGAYYGYEAFCQQKGITEIGALTEMDGILVEDFYGTYFSKTKKHNAAPDSITYYDVPVDSVTINGEEKSGLYDMAQWNKRDKYAAFLWGNHGITTIYSSNNLRHKEGETSRILLIKDSYGNCFAPYLTYQYDEVWVIDLRSIPNKMSELLAAQSFDDVLILYNFMNFASDTNLAKLRY